MIMRVIKVVLKHLFLNCVQHCLLLNVLLNELTIYFCVNAVHPRPCTPQTPGYNTYQLKNFISVMHKRTSGVTLKLL